MADMDIDDLLESISPTKAAPAPTASTTTPAAGAPVTPSSKQIEDELFELLNTPSTSLALTSDSKIVPSTILASAASTATPFDDTSAFLSWLQESPPKTTITPIKPLSSAAVESASANDATAPAAASRADVQLEDILGDSASQSAAPSVALENAPSSPVVVSSPTQPKPAHEMKEPASSLLSVSVGLPAPTENPSSGHASATPSSLNDTFFNDVFGGERSPPKSPVVKSASAMSKATYVESLERVLNSAFPDVGELRGLIDEAGYIPGQYHAQVLLLLLTGSSLLDEEAQRYIATDAEQQFYPELCADCDALVRSVEGVPSDHESVSQEMKDTIILYCQRRNVEYKHDFSRILSSIAATKYKVPKAIASSLFYSLATSFMPLVGLQYTALELAVDVVHRWLRLLLLYHCPALAQHLDRILPGWERPSKDLSTTQQAKYSKILAGSSHLDELEKELLGGDSFDYDYSGASGASSEKVIQSASPKTKEHCGVIPSSWIISFFAGSMPANEAAKILDWAVFNGERYAGLYFIVALLTLHSSTLLKMPGPAVQKWMDSVYANAPRWFQSCQVSPNANDPHFADTQPVDCSGDKVSWTAFTRAWIQATSVLVASTPVAFREALSRTETWAVLTADKQRQALSAQLLTLHHHEDDDESNIFGGKKDRRATGAAEDDSGSETESEGSGQESDEQQGKASTESGGGDSSNHGGILTGATLFVKSILQGGNRTESDAGSGGLDSSSSTASFAQDRKRPEDTLCLWAEASEVIPCVTTNNRRAQPAHLDVRTAFCAAFRQTPCTGSEMDAEASDRMGSCFFLSRGAGDGAPTYFGIDCRSEEERALGLLPKAYVIDADIITDGESMSALMAVLAPLASTTHICVIGAGDDYYRWKHAQSQAAKRFRGKSSRRKDAAALQHLIAERRNAVNAVAMYLTQKAFSHVSILEGGFVAAAKYLARPDSKATLETALVDIQQRPQLYSLLGLPLPAPSGGNGPWPTQRGSIASLLTDGKSAVSSLLSNWSQPVASTSASTASVPSASVPTSTAGSSPTDASQAGSTAASISTATATAGASSSSTPTPTTAAEPPKPLLGGWGKSLTMFGAQSLDSLRKVVTTTASTTHPSGGAAGSSASAIGSTAEAASSPPGRRHGGHSFSIDEEDDDDGLGPRPAHAVQDTNTISISRTDAERAQALAMHRMSGLKKGDIVTICRAELPGSVLFPAHKLKTVALTAEEIAAEQSQALAAAATAAASIESREGGAAIPLVKKEREVELTRYLVISRERFLVLDAKGGAVGSVAVVKSNRHLTELAKMTFRKKDPELVTLHFLSADGKLKPSAYRVKKHGDFTKCLQKNMERFK